MLFTRLAITRHWATTAIVIAVCVLGFVTYLGLPLNQFPNVPIPVVSIVTVYPGANPEEIEAQISRPIEDAVASLSDIDQLMSTSGDGFSMVTVLFTDKADNDKIGQEVERRVNSIVAEFPTGANRPVVQKIDLGQVPVMQLALVNEALTPEEIYRAAKDVLSPGVEQISGVSQVELVGGQQAEVQVAIDPIRMGAYGVTLAQVQGALASSNASLPGGRVVQGAEQFDLQVTGRVTRPEDLADIVVGGTAGQLVRIRDIATVSTGSRERSQITRVNGKQAVLLAIGQQSGTNLTDVTDQVRAAMAELSGALPEGSELVVAQDLTPFVRASLDGIQEELLLAVFLTSVILFLFLHNWRAAVIVLVSIPTTLLTTFVLMDLMGFSLNFLSMLGLTLTIGILVDDSIVVIENILRHFARGEQPFQAAMMGRAEIGMAAVAITLVDVVVFAPTGMVSGQIGGFFREFGFTVAAATLTSLVVSFALTPMLAARFLKPETEGKVGGFGARFSARWDRGFEGVERWYRDVLIWSLGSMWHRFVICAGAGFTVVAGIYLVASGIIPAEFVPVTDDGYFVVRTEAPPGSSLEAHDAAMRRVETILMEMPEIEIVTASIGISATGFFGSVSAGQARYGNVTVITTGHDSGRRDVFSIVDDARERLQAVPGVTVKVNVPGGGSDNQQPVAMRLTGPEFAPLAGLATQLQDEMARTPGLINVSNNAPVGQPQIRIAVDQLRAADLGVSTASIGLAVRTAFAGVVATKFQQPDGTFQDVRLQLAPGSRTDIAQVMDLPVPTATGQIVRLGQVTTITRESGPTQIDHFDRERVITVGAELDTGYALGQMTPIVTEMTERLALPEGYEASLGGTSEEQAESFGQLFLALGASVLFAYLLMAVLYNSLTHPLVILFSLPAAVGGAMFGLLAFGYAFSVFSMIGLILLVGLAIKNGILLVDRTNHNREQGMRITEALLDAGPARLRAILMTSLTIALALAPIAFKFGEGAELRAPLAATVLGGVISSTVLTLVLVPVVYVLFDDVARQMRRLFGLRPAAPMMGEAERAAEVTL